METLLTLLVFGGLVFVMMRFGCGSHAGKHAGHGASAHKGGCCGGHGHGHGQDARSHRDKGPKGAEPSAKETEKIGGPNHA